MFPFPQKYAARIVVSNILLSLMHTYCGNRPVHGNGSTHERLLEVRAALARITLCLEGKAHSISPSSNRYHGNVGFFLSILLSSLRGMLTHTSPQVLHVSLEKRAILSSLPQKRRVSHNIHSPLSATMRSTHMFLSYSHRSFARIERIHSFTVLLQLICSFNRRILPLETAFAHGNHICTPACTQDEHHETEIKACPYTHIRALISAQASK